MYPSTGKQTSEYGNCFKYLCIFLRIVCITYICALLFFLFTLFLLLTFFLFFLPTIKTRKFLQRLKIRKIISDNIKNRITTYQKSIIQIKTNFHIVYRIQYLIYPQDTYMHSICVYVPLRIHKIK